MSRVISIIFFFFSSRRRHTRWTGDWSSDVCSSDLRAGMLETMGEDYIRTARAKGLAERNVIVKHGLRAALTPIVTIFGLDLGLLLGGAVLTEFTFSLHGLGLFTVL